MSTAPQSIENAPLALAKPYLLEFVLPGLPRTANGSHGHWRSKFSHTKMWKQKIFTACWHKRPEVPLEKARITFTRCSGRECDFDNLVISFKACMDGLKQAGIIVDDKTANVGRSEYLWEKGKNGKGFIKIKVEGLAA